MKGSRRESYARLAASVEAVLHALEGEAPLRPRRAAGFQGKRVRDRLQRQKGVLERLQQGEVTPEEALVLLLEEQAPAAPAPEVGAWLSRLGGSLRRLGAVPREASPGAPDDDLPDGGKDD